MDELLRGVLSFFEVLHPLRHVLAAVGSTLSFRAIKSYRLIRRTKVDVFPPDTNQVLYALIFKRCLCLN